MLYHHTPRFQILMHYALQLQKITPLYGKTGMPIPFSINELALRIGIKNAVLAKFMREKNIPKFDSQDLSKIAIDECMWKLPKESDAKLVWDYLSKNGFIKKAINTHGIKKHKLFSYRAAATAMMSLYDANEKNISKYSKNGVTDCSNEQTTGTKKEWIAFKFSTRKPGFILRSRFTITNFQDEYFHIEDQQESSGEMEESGERFAETSSGFGFIKTDRLWCFLKENDFFQPRIFTFDKFISPAPKNLSFLTSGKFSTIYGTVSEGDKRYTNAFYNLNVVLMDIGLFRAAYKKRFSGKRYSHDEQIESMPFTREEQRKYKNKGPFFTPSYIEEYLLKGQRPWEL